MALLFFQGKGFLKTPEKKHGMHSYTMTAASSKPIFSAVKVHASFTGGKKCLALDDFNSA